MDRQQIQKNYESKPFKEWDGITPLCLYDDSKFFFSEDDITDYLYEDDADPIAAEDLMLMICEPNYYPQIRYEDYVEDIMPEDWDGDFPKELEKRLIEINEFIKTMKPCSWGEGRFRTSYTPLTPTNGSGI